MLKKLSIALICASSILFAADKLDYSQNPPGGLSVENVPLFVVIGADDCGDDETVRWLVDFLEKKKNPGKANKATFDQTSPKMAFYVNGKYAKDAGASWKYAYTKGHEIGNHTVTHFLDEKWQPLDARKYDADVWYKEMIQNDSIIIKTIGMKLSEIVGFRVPRLEYNREAYLSMKKRGFLYDCSIEEGGQPGQDGTNFYWPYTLDNGSEIDSLQASWSAGEDDWGYKKIGKIPGLWQIPVYNYIVPHDSLADKYNFKKGLRSRIKKGIDYFNDTTGNLTGFDYNVFAPYDWAGAQMNSEGYLATLKYSFDQHKKGNRAPFALGMHPDFYTKASDEYYGKEDDYMARRKVVEDFITYALTFKEVRFVTGAQLIEWMKNPVGLDGKKGLQK